MPSPAETIEGHFPWYVDSCDTDNLDCQCGWTTNQGIQAWSTHLAEQLTTPTRQHQLHNTAQRHGGWNQPWTFCGDTHCQDCRLLGITS